MCYYKNCIKYGLTKYNALQAVSKLGLVMA